MPKLQVITGAGRGAALPVHWLCGSSRSRVAPGSAGRSHRRGISRVNSVATQTPGERPSGRRGEKLGRARGRPWRGWGGGKESLFLTLRGGGCSRRHLSAPSAAGAALTRSDLQEAISRHGRLELDTRATGHRGLSSCTPLSPQPRKPRGSLAGGSGSGWQRAPATGPCISTRPRVSPLPPRSLSFSL